MTQKEEGFFLPFDFLQLGCFLGQTRGLLFLLERVENCHTSRWRRTADVLQTHFNNISVQEYRFFFFCKNLQVAHSEIPAWVICFGFLVSSRQALKRLVCVSANDWPEALKTYWNNNPKDSKLTSVWVKLASSSSPLPLWGFGAF